jgi:hypothetical protein
MDGRTRLRTNYIESLLQFHAQQGHPISQLPCLKNQPLDFFELHMEMEKRGGISKVWIYNNYCLDFYILFIQNIEMNWLGRKIKCLE